jgi:hypothetical protein
VIDLRHIIAFLIAPVLPLLAVVLALAIYGQSSTSVELKGGLLIAYLSAALFGFPAWILLKRFGLRSRLSFILAGGLSAVATYWIAWEFLPVVAAYRDGRYDLRQSFRALLISDYPMMAPEMAFLGLLAGLVFWLIEWPDRTN